VSASLVIPRRCNGPLGHGHGGYSCGAVAGLVEGPAQVSLRRPVPLGTPLTVVPGADATAVLDGDALVAEARPAARLGLDPPRVSPGEAHEAAARHRDTGMAAFAHCYVCGPEREDSLRVHAGPVPGRDVVATPWTPPAWTAGADGATRTEHVWAAMDCPTYDAAHLGEPPSTSFLVRMQARVDAPVARETEHVVVAWPLGRDGRKRTAAAAVLAADGAVLAVAEALILEVVP
jgi:hypothetical protein